MYAKLLNLLTSI